VKKKPIRILKKIDRFDFGFISLKPKKPNRTQTEKKPSQTGKKPSQTEKTKPTQFEPVFFLK